MDDRYNLHGVKIGQQAIFDIAVVPEYLYKYLARKGLGADLMLSQVAIDQRLSTEEIALLIYLNGYDFERSLKHDLWLGCWNTTEEIRVHKKSSDLVLVAKIEAAFTMSYGQNVQKEADSLFNSVCNETSPSYDFVVMGTKIWLVLKAGFLTAFKDPMKRLQFYRDYIKSVGEITPFSTVADTSVFSHYVEELLG